MHQFWCLLSLWHIGPCKFSASRPYTRGYRWGLFQSVPQTTQEGSWNIWRFTFLLTYWLTSCELLLFLLSLTDLQKETALSTTPEPIVVILRKIRDIKAWIKSSLEDIHSHSIPHCFKFQNSAKGEVIMFSKNWSSDPWCNEQDAVKLLKVIDISFFTSHSCNKSIDGKWDRVDVLCMYIFSFSVSACWCTTCC